MYGSSGSLLIDNQPMGDTQQNTVIGGLLCNHGLAKLMSLTSHFAITNKGKDMISDMEQRDIGEEVCWMKTTEMPCNSWREYGAQTTESMYRCLGNIMSICFVRH